MLGDLQLLQDGFGPQGRDQIVHGLISREFRSRHQLSNSFIRNLACGVEAHHELPNNAVERRLEVDR
eukprot:8326770-Pyramimonas_sp.AAC.1